jgi:hypothetical protein
MMNETSQAAAPASPAAIPFDLHIHFQGAFVFSVKTEGNSSDPAAKLAGIEVYVPACGHTHAATINTGGTYMLENYWHCIDPVYSATPAPEAMTLGQLHQKIGANTPWTPGNRPIAGGWEVAFALPKPPNDWQCDLLVPGAASCFSGNDAGIIPASAAIEQILIYKQVLPTSKFHGACFPVNLIATEGRVVDLYLTSESPYIPTRQHERRAVDAVAKLLGLDLMLETPLGPANVPSGAVHPMTKTGLCMMAIVSGPMVG